MIRNCLVFAALLLSFSGTARAASILEPNGPWTITEAADQCRLMRNFGSKEAPFVLRFARGSGIDNFDSVVAGSIIPDLNERITVRLRLVPGNQVQEFTAISTKIPGRKENFIRWFDGDATILDSVSDDQQIEFSVEGKFVVTLHAAKAKSALRGLTACHERLLNSWGLDTAAQRALSKRATPRAPPANWVTTRDYPNDALLRSISGSAIVLLTIDAGGNVTQCKVVMTAGLKSLDAASCNTLQLRAKYHPALDGQGKPVASQDIQRIRWLIPT